MRILFIILFCTFSTLFPRSGEARDLYFRHYTNKQGLSHNTVYCALQDKRGFMWFGTDDGLNRFDGHSFRIYRHDFRDRNSLANDRIVSLFEDSTGRLWINTYSHTCYYDDRTDTFHPLTFPGGDGTPEQFRQIGEDKRGHLWLIGHDRIARCHPSGKEPPRLYPEGRQIHPVALTMDEEGEPLLAGPHALYRYRPESDTFEPIPLLTEKEKANSAHLSALHIVAGEGVLAGTDREGLKMYDRHAGTTETLIPDIQVRDITQTDKHTYWIASESGIYILDIASRSVEHLQKSLTDGYTISDNAVYSVTRDREGGIWATTFFGGINYLPRQYVPFHYFIGGKTHPQLLGNAVREICPDRFGNIWIGTEDNGINRYDPATREITNFSRSNPLHPLSATNIHGLLADGDYLWIGTFNTGIDLMEIASGKIVRRYTRAGTHHRLPSDFVLCFCHLSDDEILVGTAAGLALFDKREGRFTPWATEIRSMVRQIYKSRAGDIWIATTTGAYRYSGKGRKSRHYTAGKKGSPTIGDNNVTSLFEDSKGRIWVATVHGFSLYDAESDTFSRITTENGLPSNIVHRILEDESHHFWIATANGLVRFDPSTRRMKTYSYTEGLPETQFNYCSAYKAPDGTMYMGTINGMIAFNPDDFKEDTYSPPVCITPLLAAGSRTGDPRHDTPRITESGRLELPHDHSGVTLSFVALSYTSPEAIQYAHRLEGVDKEWIYGKESREATYPHLPPGNYLFRVKSTNSSGVWQDNETTLPITVTPPLWATGRACLLYLLLAGLLLLLLCRRKRAQTEESSPAGSQPAESSPRQEEESPAPQEERPAAEKNSSQAVDDLFLRRLNECLEEHLADESLSVEMLAETMGISTSSLYRKVKGLSGLSPNDFIRAARLQKAIRLMQDGESRISEIAFRVGFSSPAYFSTCFQKQYGMTPSEYQKQAAAKS